MSHRSPIVCECLKVSEASVLRALKTRAPRTLSELARHTGAGEGCTACHPLLRQYLERRGHACVSPSSLPPAARSDSSPALSS